MLDKIKYTLLFAITLCFAASCGKDPYFDFEVSGEGSGQHVTPDRTVSPDVRNVLIYVAAGFNNLSGSLAQDVDELWNNPLPGRRTSTDPVLLILSRIADSSDYSNPSPAVLYRLYSDEDGRAVGDTLRTWSAETPLSKASTLREALEFVEDSFPGNRYGMMFSSHATGWLPARYYYNPNVFETPDVSVSRRAPGRNLREVFPPLVQEAGMPAVKSIGMDEGDQVLEMELEDFAAAIPFHLDYLIFDACLMGCVEVAYELRGVADLVGFSPTEVLAYGFDYSTLTGFLMTGTPDPIGVCRAYFDFYNAQTDGKMRSATISVVETGKMDALAQVCKSLFEKYRDKIAVLPGNQVQGYFRNNRHYFYDLQDILVQAGITAQEQASLSDALDQCVVYKAATPSFLLDISIKSYSGLSMYLPSMGSTYLDTFYRSHVAWNQATSLVQ